MLRLNNKVRPFGFWSQKVLPLVYDDSLSYYEVLSKITFKINEIIDCFNNSVKESIKVLIQEYFIDILYNSTDESIIINMEDKNNA